MFKKIISILGEAIPLIIMIDLIPFITNDDVLTLIYICIIATGLIIKKEKNDFLILIAGFFIMVLSESFFISTGVETFTRTSLLGIMPLWLPFLWAYAFIVMRRSLAILAL